LSYKPVKQCYFIVFKIVSKEILRVMVKTQHLSLFWALGTARGQKSQMPSSTFMNVEKRSSR